VAKIQNVVKGDVIIERANGKNRMTPVRQVVINACSKRGVHINNNACYDWGTDVRIVEGEGNLGDLEKEMTGLGDLEEDLDVDVREAIFEEMADLLVKH
jgi:hypothetical protein